MALNLSMSDIELCSLHCQLNKIQAVSQFSIKAFEISGKEIPGTKQLGGIFLMHAFLTAAVPVKIKYIIYFHKKSATRVGRLLLSCFGDSIQYGKSQALFSFYFNFFFYFRHDGFLILLNLGFHA